MDSHAATGAKRASSRLVVAKSLAAALVCLVLMAASLAVTFAQEASAQALMASVTFVEVRVESGDSLWTIAAAHAVDGLSTSQTMELIRKQNELSTSELQVGATLLVPETSS